MATASSKVLHDRDLSCNLLFRLLIRTRTWWGSLDMENDIGHPRFKFGVARLTYNCYSTSIGGWAFFATP